MTPNEYQHPPGHPQAVADGCSCPVMDNANGNGCGYVDAAGNPLYVLDMECRLHNGAPEPNPQDMCFEAETYARLMWTLTKKLFKLSQEFFGLHITDNPV